MKKNYSARRRGTSVAAAALSFALVAPFAQPVAVAADGPASLNTSADRALPYNVDPECFVPGTQYQYEATENKPIPDAVVADGIANGYVRDGLGTTNAKNTLSGHVYLGGYGAISNNATLSKTEVPEGTKVYMQWTSATGVKSPIYVTETHNIPADATGAGGDGSYVFDLREGFYDNQGNHHVFGAYNDQLYRVWVEPFVNPVSDNMVYPVRAGDGIRAYERTSFGGLRNYGQFQFIGVNQQRVDRWVTELPIDVATNKNYMMANNVVAMPYVGHGGGTSTGKNRVSGQVWLESGRGADGSNSMAGPSYQPGDSGKDAPAGGYTVYLTTLTPKGVAGLSDIDQLPREQRTAVTKQRLLDNPDWLHTTYSVKTDAKGNYSIDGIEVAGQSFRDTRSHVYMWVEDPTGVIVQTHSGWVTPEFRDALGGENWRPTPISGLLAGAVYNVNFAITSTPQESNIQLFIRNFDALQYAAKPGDTANLLIDGTVPLQDTRIVWTKTDTSRRTVVIDPATGEAAVDSRGNVVTDPEAYAGTAVKACGDEADANLTVPDSAQDGDLYTALLYVGADVRSSDTFIVSTGAASSFEPDYPQVVAPTQKESTPPVFFEEVNGEPGAQVPTSSVPVDRYELAQNPPAGAAVDAGTGVVSLPDSSRGKRNAVTLPDGTQVIRVPVVVVYKDGTRDVAFAKFEPLPVDADRFQPVYKPTKVGTEEKFTVTPAWQNSSGDPLPSGPANTTFAINQDDLPKDANDNPVFTGVSVNPTTGEITATSTTVWGDFLIPVTVTYPDGSTDTVNASVHVNSQADTHTPMGRDLTVELNAKPGAEEAITNVSQLPAGTTFAWVTEPDTSVPGVLHNAVRVTYPDGSTEDVTVKITVLGDRDKYQPKPTTQTVDVNATPAAEDSIANKNELPTNTTYEWLDKPDTSTIGKRPAAVVVRYPDGTEERVDVEVLVVAPLQVHALPNVTLPVGEEITPIPVRATQNDELVDADIEVFWYEQDDNEQNTPITGLKYNPETKQIEGTPTVAGEKRAVLVRATYGGEVADTYFFISTEVDTDKDGIPDRIEKIIGTDPNKADTDSDGINDGDEVSGQGNKFDGKPTDPKKADTDGDGVSDGDEVTRVDGNGNPAPTDPNNPDTDGDGVNDGDEQKWGTDPTDAKSVPPTIVPGTVVETVIKGEDKVLDDTVKNATSDTKATVVDGNGKEIGTATIGDDGKITVNVPTDKPEGPAQVVITHPDANGTSQEVGRIDIAVVRPGTRAVEFTPSYAATNLEPDTQATVTPTWKDDKQPKTALKSVAGEKSAGADDWTITTDNTGKVTAKAPTNDQVKAEYERLFPNGAGTWEAFVAGFTNYARPTETVTFTYDDGSQNIAKANFDLVGQDGKSILDPQGDFDGDGVKNKDEIEQNTNPFDENSKSGIKPGSLIDEVKAGDPEGTKLDDVVTNPTTGMTGEVIGKDEQGNYKKIEGATVTVNPETGEITVSVPENATPGIGSVQITDKDGNPVGNPIVINIVAPDPSIVQGEKKDEITTGTDTKLDDKVKNPTTGMTGEVIGKDEQGNDKKIEGATVTVNPETGEITVNVPKDSGYEGPATVVVKDKNGNQVGGPIEVTVKQPATEASQFSPEYKDTTQVRVDGRANTANPFGDTTAPVQKVNPSDVRDWTSSPVGNSGVIDVKAPTTAQVIAEFNRVFPDGLQGATTEQKLEALKNGLDGYANPTTNVEFTYTDGSTDIAEAKLELLDKNGVNILDPKGDLDGDGVDNQTELENNSNPADPNSKPADKQPEAPKTTVDGSKSNTVKPTNEQQDTGITVTNPDNDTKVEAKDEDGKTIPVFIDKDGKVQIVPGTDVDGPITVTITDSDLDKPVTVKVPVEGHTEGKDDNGIIPGTNAKDSVPADGKPHKIDDKVAKPTEGMGGTVTVKDENGNDKTVEDATVTVDPKTGEITVSVPEGTPLGDATVQITDPEGKNVGDPIKVEITKPAPTLDNKNTIDEVIADGEGHTLGDTVKNPTDGMGGKVYDKDGEEIEGAKVTVTPSEDGKTGEITVSIPEGTPAGAAKVEITDNQGNKIGETIITIKPVPSVTDGTEGNQKVPADGNGHKLEDKVANPTDGLTGEVTVKDKDGNDVTIPVTVDPNTGEITVTIPKETRPGEATVVIRDKDGNTVGEVKIEITNQAGQFDPKYDDTTNVPAGGNANTNDPFAGQDANVEKLDVTKLESAKNWDFTQVGKTGIINAKAPSNEQVSAAIKENLPNGAQGATDDAKWNDFVEKMKGYAQPEVGVTITYTDGSTDGTEAKFDLVGKDGKSLLDPDGDFDRDGVSNKEEIVRGLDPANEDTDGDGIKDGDEIKRGSDPKKADAKFGQIIVDSVIRGNVGSPIADARNPITISAGGAKVELVKGQLPKGLKFEDGKITGTPEEAGRFTTTFEAKDNEGKVTDTRTVIFQIAEAAKPAPKSSSALTDDQRGRCIATGLGLGLPLLALVPIALASQVAIPGLPPVFQEVSARFQDANTALQQQLGVFQPQFAGQIDDINAQLKVFGADLTKVGTALAIVAASILAGTLLFDACDTNGGFNSSKNESSSKK